uniref:Uncharacterized protein n=1 Tax=Leersia perrieri TaxID=77586 RepID=A0A0D9VKS0_9ORYZ
MSGCFGGQVRGAAAAAKSSPAPAPTTTHPRYVPQRGVVLRSALRAFFCCFSSGSAKTRPLPR